MSAIGNKDIQVMEFLYDFSVHGGAIGQIDLSDRLGNAIPSGAIMLRASYYVETAFTSGGAATVAIGDVASAARYLAATAFDNAAFADEKVAAAAIGVPLKVASANAGKIAITVAAAALTAGKMRIFVEYVQEKA